MSFLTYFHMLYLYSIESVSVSVSASSTSLLVNSCWHACVQSNPTQSADRVQSSPVQSSPVALSLLRSSLLLPIGLSSPTTTLPLSFPSSSLVPKNTLHAPLSLPLPSPFIPIPCTDPSPQPPTHTLPNPNSNLLSPPFPSTSNLPNPSKHPQPHTLDLPFPLRTPHTPRPHSSPSQLYSHAHWAQCSLVGG